MPEDPVPAGWKPILSAVNIFLDCTMDCSKDVEWAPKKAKYWRYKDLDAIDKPTEFWCGECGK